MKLKLITHYALILLALGMSLPSFADHQKTGAPAPAASVASKEASSVIQFYNKDFDFDWNNAKTIPDSKAKIAQVESFLKSLPNSPHMPASDRHALGELNYKLGAFYLHVNRQPDLAIAKLDAAKSLLSSKKEKAWIDNQFAYAYEQKFVISGQNTDKEQALSYTKKVISNQRTAEVAFADCVNGLIYNDSKDYPKAEASYSKALSIYEKLPGGKDDQYARAKNRLANIILDQDGRDQEALTMLVELNQYWLSKPDISQDPYAARNFIALGKAYLKTEDNDDALNAFNSAIQIYKQVYGDHSSQLAQPYQLLSQTYKKLGNDELAISYQKKSDEMKEA